MGMFSDANFKRIIKIVGKLFKTIFGYIVNNLNSKKLSVILLNNSHTCDIHFISL